MTAPLGGAVLAVLAAVGVHLLWSDLALGRRRLSWRADGLGGAARKQRRPSLDEWLVQAGLADVRPAELLGACATLLVIGAVAGYALFGGLAAALVIGLAFAVMPVAGARRRRAERLAVAREAWPRLIEEVRLLTSSLGRSIPQALFEVGRRAPEELRPAFEAAHREWILSTDFARTTAVLKERLADPTADAACETLLVAHDLGGTDLDRRLTALAEDRTLDAQGRRDARAQQAGVRFTRRFVLAVPAGMALAGFSIGNGRAAYATGLGQALVLAGIACTALCWAWAGRLLRLPDEQRVFDR